MANAYFYNKLFRKAVSIFGAQFNEMFVYRYNPDGSIAQKLPIPISYGPREKFLARVQGDRQGTREIAMQLPRMAFEITNFDRDASRQVNKINEVRNRTTKQSAFVSVPYRIDFQLDIMVKTIEDGLQLIEQIIPYFAPHVTVSADLINGVTQDDITINLNSTSWTDTYAENFEQRRVLIITLQFTMGFMFYGPQREKKVIKYVTVNTWNNPDLTGQLSEYTLQPGLTANGQPTSNVAQSIDYKLINETDDYGLIEEISEGEFDGS